MIRFVERSLENVTCCVFTYRQKNRKTRWVVYFQHAVQRSRTVTTEMPGQANSCVQISRGKQAFLLFGYRDQRWHY